jgi:3-phosphoshikimate 1-carboxyvinyltransferase
MPVFLRKTKIIRPAIIKLPSSKSESNRALVINALAGSKTIVQNISEARDTQTMLRLLNSNDKTMDVLDAGTTMRFLIAYCSVLNLNRILTGTDRMLERPVGILIDSLCELGANIRYVQKEGYPPVETISFPRQIRDHISIRGDVSSQYISALLMIAPVLRNGLTLELTGKIGSRPYIGMTLGIMKNFGIRSDWNENIIKVEPQPYIPASFNVQPDWTGASYWYSLVALADQAEIFLPGLSDKSFQGDVVISEIMNFLGVKSEFNKEGVILTKQDSLKEFSWDFTDCPDLAQTVAVCAASKGIKFHFKGLESLRIKETDRILALQKELSKIGAIFQEVTPHEWILYPVEKSLLPSSAVFETYDDHRMAMAFTPLVTQMDITIHNHTVVKKSYPGFWKDLERTGIEIKIQ